jgi:hypothetical protein
MNSMSYLPMLLAIFMGISVLIFYKILENHSNKQDKLLLGK